ncbi:MAG: GIY-YIG nuclease family protein [Alphaproteobacteria bacterium]
MLANHNDRALYVGCTNSIEQRMMQHKTGAFAYAHTLKYNIIKLVWFEEQPDGDTAYQREHRLKRWNREWKLALIDAFNPAWEDLAKDWLGAGETPDQVGGNCVRLER